MATRQSEALKLVARARRVGWPVEQMDEAGVWLITCPDQMKVSVHMSPSDVNSHRVILRKLNAKGLAEAEAEQDERDEQDRQQKLAADREANERRTAEMQKRAAALARAAGPYGSTQPTIEELLAEHPAPRVFLRVLVTPEMAAAILERNQPTEKAPWRMRPLNRETIARRSNDLRTGRWRWMHQGTALDEDGRLQDGQNRLTAIVETGIAAEMMVSVGMPRDNLAVIDVGSRRSPAQVLYMLGAGSAAATAAAVRLLHLYEVWGPAMLAHASERITNDVASELYSRLDPEGWEFALTSAYALRREIRVAPSGVAAGLYLVRTRLPKDDERPDEFADGLIRGADLTDSDPLWVLRRSLTRQASGVSRKLPAAELMALVVKGWNAHARGERTKILVVRADSPMPTVYTGA